MYIEVKLIQNVGDFYTFCEIGFENKKIFRELLSFSDKYSKIFIHFKSNT